MKNAVVCVLIFLGSTVWSQLQQFKNESGKIGFKNAADEIVVPCRFDAVDYVNKSKISESTIIVLAGEKYGLLAPDGRILLDVEYDEVYVSYPALQYIGFKKSGKHGVLMGKNGSILLAPTYDERIIFELNEPHAKVVLDEKVGIVNVKLEAFIPPVHQSYNPDQSGLFCLRKNDKFGFYDRKGELIIPFEYEEVGYIIKKSNRIPLKRNGKWGALDFTGKVVIPLEYDEMGSFSDKLASVAKNGKYGYIDLNGKVVIPLIYDEADYFFAQTTFVGKLQSDGTMKFAVIDQRGKLITDFVYDGFYEFYLDGFSLVQKGGKWGAVNIAGKEILPTRYNEDDFNLEFYVHDKIFIHVKEAHGVQIYNTEGKALLPQGYDVVEYLDLEEERLAVQVLKAGKTGVLVLGSDKVMIPCEFDGISFYDFENSRFVRVRRNDLYGIWDLETGKLVVPTQFDAVEEQDFYVKANKFYFHVSKDDKHGIWDALANKLIVPLEFRSVYFFDEVKQSNKKYFFEGITHQEKRALYDQDGKSIIPLDKRWLALSFVHYEKNKYYFVVQDRSSGKMGCYDSNGVLALSFDYDEINSIKAGKATVQVDGAVKEVVLKTK